MALAYCLEYLESNNLVKITIPGEYIEINPPTHEVELLKTLPGAVNIRYADGKRTADALQVMNLIMDGTRNGENL